MMLTALTRAVPESIGRSELTYLERAPIDVAVAREQHAQYREALAALGCTLHELPPEPTLPDSVFVEDTAVVLPELAVITRPGAPSRQPETRSIAQALQAWRPLKSIEAPGTLDGGDVLCLGATIFVGESTRTNPDGIRQFREIVAPYGYGVQVVAVSGCLHLKSAVTRVGEAEVLLNPAWIDPSIFEGFGRIEVHRDEPAAANALWTGGTILLPSGFPLTRRKIERAGREVMTVNSSELAKAEGGLTCCSLLVSSR